MRAWITLRPAQPRETVCATRRLRAAALSGRSARVDEGKAVEPAAGPRRDGDRCRAAPLRPRRACCPLRVASPAVSTVTGETRTHS
jgi:hypothetical protein